MSSTANPLTFQPHFNIPVRYFCFLLPNLIIAILSRCTSPFAAASLTDFLFLHFESFLIPPIFLLSVFCVLISSTRFISVTSILTNFVHEVLLIPLTRPPRLCTGLQRYQTLRLSFVRSILGLQLLRALISKRLRRSSYHKPSRT